MKVIADWQWDCVLFCFSNARPRYWKALVPCVWSRGLEATGSSYLGVVEITNKVLIFLQPALFVCVGHVRMQQCGCFSPDSICNRERGGGLCHLRSMVDHRYKENNCLGLPT